MAERHIRPDPNREPTHPGALLREDVLPVIGELVMAVAKKLGVTRQHLHRVLAEKAPVTPDMALRLGKFCGNGPDLAGMQQATTSGTPSARCGRWWRRYRPRRRGRRRFSLRGLGASPLSAYMCCGLGISFHFPCPLAAMSSRLLMRCRIHRTVLSWSSPTTSRASSYKLPVRFGSCILQGLKDRILDESRYTVLLVYVGPFD